MIDILEGSSAKTIGIRLHGKLLHKDYQEFIPRLESLIAEHGKIRVYFEMTEFEGVELRAFWDELKFDIKNCTKVERCTVVGNRSWEKWATLMSKAIFIKADLRYFDVSESEDAWKWVNEETAKKKSCCCGKSE